MPTRLEELVRAAAEADERHAEVAARLKAVKTEYEESIDQQYLAKKAVYDHVDALVAEVAHAHHP